MSRSAANNSKSLNLPGYLQSPANIIKEAKEEIARLPYDPLRIRSTKRPETPRDATRNLFDRSSNERGRPPSTFSLGSRHFDPNSRPNSSSIRQLEPLDHKPRLSIDGDKVSAPKPPSDPNRQKRSATSRLKHSNSSDSFEINSKSDAIITKESNISENYQPSYRGDSSMEINKKIEYRASSGGKKSECLDHINGSTGIKSTAIDAPPRTNSGGKNKKDEESQEERKYFDSFVLPLLQNINEYNGDTDKLIEICDKLYNVLDDKNLLGKVCKRRSVILVHIFTLLDVDSPKLALKTVRLVLALKVSGKNLANVFKFLFKVSKNDENDHFFMDENLLKLILESVEQSHSLDSLDSLVYCIGSLKFLTSNSKCLKLLAKFDFLSILSKLLSYLNQETISYYTDMEGRAKLESVEHILIQLTVCFRNISDSSEIRSGLITSGAIEKLLLLYKLWRDNFSIIMNVSRIFSKLTLHNEFIYVVVQFSSLFGNILAALDAHRSREDIAVRICFFLGNIAAKDDDSRYLIYKSDRAADILIGVLKLYIDPILEVPSREIEKPKMIDTLVKAIRLIANVAINAKVGTDLVCREDLVHLLINIINKLPSSVETNELLINALATLNNLSYYDVPKSAVAKHQIAIASLVPKFVDYSKVELLTEANRVLANLSRSKNIRDWMVNQRVDEALITLLESEHSDIVFSACGGLINLMKDEEKRCRLKQQNGIEKLLDVLRDFGKSDAILASLVCKILLNYTGKMTSSEEYLGEKNSIDLIELLSDIIGQTDSFFKDHNDENMKDFIEKCIDDELLPVATLLRDRVEKNLSQFDVLPPP